MIPALQAIHGTAPPLVSASPVAAAEAPVVGNPFGSENPEEYPPSAPDFDHGVGTTGFNNVDEEEEDTVGV